MNPYDDYDQSYRENFNSYPFYGTDRFQAYRILERELKHYEGVSLETALEGKFIENQGGVCFKVGKSEPIKLPEFNQSRVKLDIASNLTLLYGVGVNEEIKLRTEGFENLYDLCDHPRWSEEAQQMLKLIEQADLNNLFHSINRWYSQNHPLNLTLGKLLKPEEFIYFDIETLGLSYKPVIVIGLAEYKNFQLNTYQYVVTNINEESSVLHCFQEHLKGKRAMVTYNGKNFDVPYVKERFNHYGIESFQEIPNFDLLFFTRKAWRNAMPNCKLGTVEKYQLDIDRKEDIPGALVPDFYYTYYTRGNPGPLKTIVEHNRQDIISMVYILYKLWREWC